MLEIVLRIIKKLNRNELCLLLAAVTGWCDHMLALRCPKCGHEFYHHVHVYPAGSVEEFQEWLATEKMTEADKWEAAKLLAETEEREAEARQLQPTDPVTWKTISR